MERAILKNVKDGISRPLGGREIQKTKVYTVLLDTLDMRSIILKNVCQIYKLTDMIYLLNC